MRCEVDSRALDRGNRVAHLPIRGRNQMRRWLLQRSVQMSALSPQACVFCDKHGLQAKNHVLYEDVDLVAIKDINPRARRHLLIISREHIESVDDLTAEHIDLVKRMIHTGRKILANDGFIEPQTYQLGFHRPPFTSVPHLHLHCLAFPFLPFWNQLRYTPTVLRNYVDAEWLLHDLELQRQQLHKDVEEPPAQEHAHKQNGSS